MNTQIFSQITLIFGAIILTAGVQAQEEKSKVQVKITRDGETLKDTTYLVVDEASAELAVKMLDITLREGPTPKGKKIYAFKSENGKNYSRTSEEAEEHIIKQKECVSNGDADKDHLSVEVDKDGNKTIHKEVIVTKAGDDKEIRDVEEIIVIKKGKGGEGMAPEVEWIERGGKKVLIIDDNGREKIVKGLGDKDGTSSQTIITGDGKVIIIKEIKGDGFEKEVEVDVKVDNIDTSSHESKRSKKKKGDR